MVVAIGESGDAVCWMVVVDNDGGRGEVGFRAVDNTQIERQQMPMLNLKRQRSIWVLVL